MKSKKKKDEIISKYTPIIERYVVKKFHTFNEDAIQEGLLAMIMAVNDHKPSYKTPLNVYIFNRVSRAVKTLLYGKKHDNTDFNFTERNFENLSDLGVFIDNLSKKDAEIFRLFFIDDMTLEKIGAKMGCTKQRISQKVKVLVKQARRFYNVEDSGEA